MTTAAQPIKTQAASRLFCAAIKQYQAVSRLTKTVRESSVSAILWLSLLPNDWGMRFGDGVEVPHYEGGSRVVGSYCRFPALRIRKCSKHLRILCFYSGNFGCKSEYSLTALKHGHFFLESKSRCPTISALGKRACSRSTSSRSALTCSGVRVSTFRPTASRPPS